MNPIPHPTLVGGFSNAGTGFWEGVLGGEASPGRINYSTSKRDDIEKTEAQKDQVSANDPPMILSMPRVS